MICTVIKIYHIGGIKMLKFFKEMKDAFNEGVEEARQELDEESKLENNETRQILEELALISKEELFGTSLSAPFRTTAFNDWFTLFQSIREAKEENVIPIHLYKYGYLNELNKKDVVMLRKQQDGSFYIENEDDVLSIIQSFLLGIEISLEALNNVEPMYIPSELICFKNETLLPAWSLSAVASTLISGVEFKGVSKVKSLKIFGELLPIVQKRYSNWCDFGNAYREEDAIINNKKKQIKYTAITIHNLTFKYGSPWVRFRLEDY